MDSRRARGDVGRLARRGHFREPQVAPDRGRVRRDGQLLPGWRRGWGIGLWLADRPARAQEAVHRDRADLPGGDGRVRLVLEFLVAGDLSLHHRSRDWRRIRGGQRDHPGTHPRPQTRLHRSLHQRDLLARRGARQRRRRGDARQGRHRPRTRLADGVRDRRGDRARGAVPAPLDPGKPALADDPRRSRGRQQGGQGDRRPSRARDRPAAAASTRASACGCGGTRATGSSKASA